MDEKELKNILLTIFSVLENGGVPEYFVEARYGKDVVSSLISEGYIFREEGILFLTEKGEDIIADMRA